MADETMRTQDRASHARRTMGARTGGRSERVVRAIIRATIAELAKVGYGALRVEDVAEKAGVNKTTVYRRWPTKAELVTAAIRAVSGLSEPLPDTGTLRGDLVELARRALVFVRTPEGRALTRLVILEGGDPEVDRLSRWLRDESRARRARLVHRGRERGELPAAVDTHLVLDAIFAPIMTRELKYGDKVDLRTIERLVDLVLTGAAHGGGHL